MTFMVIEDPNALPYDPRSFLVINTETKTLVGFSPHRDGAEERLERARRKQDEEDEKNRVYLTPRESRLIYGWCDGRDRRKPEDDDFLVLCYFRELELGREMTHEESGIFWEETRPLRRQMREEREQAES